MSKNFRKKLNASVNKAIKKEFESLDGIIIEKIKKIDDCLDLHGYTKREAHSLLCDFLDHSIENNFKVVRIVTGKGIDDYSPLKNYIKDILKNLGYNYKSAPTSEGGEGAIDINL